MDELHQRKRNKGGLARVINLSCAGVTGGHANASQQQKVFTETRAITTHIQWHCFPVPTRL